MSNTISLFKSLVAIVFIPVYMIGFISKVMYLMCYAVGKGCVGAVCLTCKAFDNGQKEAARIVEKILGLEGLSAE